MAQEMKKIVLSEGFEKRNGTKPTVNAPRPPAPSAAKKPVQQNNHSNVVNRKQP